MSASESKEVREHRAIYPERDCEAGGKARTGCDGIVAGRWGDVWLCTGHALAFAEMVHETMPARAKQWAAKMRGETKR